MNKIINLLFFFILGSVTLYSQTITVTQPAHGTVFCNKDYINIFWTTTASQGSMVKIALYDEPRWPGAKPRLIITSSTQNDGFYKAPAGTFKHLPTRDYKIFIKLKKKPVTGKSGKITIKDCKKFPQKIYFIDPHTGDKWKRGQSHTIQWHNQYTRNRRVTLQLIRYPGKELVKNIASFYSMVRKTNIKTSKHTWTVPSDLGGPYRIKIFNSDLTAIGVSGVFNVPTESTVVTTTVPVTTVNKYRLTKAGGTNYDGNVFYLQFDEYPDPGPGRMRIGFHNLNYKKQHQHYLYRSFLKIDIHPSVNQGLLLKATLKYQLTNHLSVPHALGGGIVLYIPDQAWDGTPQHLFTIPLSRLTSATDITMIVSNWLLGKNPNYGLVFVGPNELQQRNSDFSISISNQVVLELQFLKKVN